MLLDALDALVVEGDLAAEPCNPLLAAFAAVAFAASWHEVVDDSVAALVAWLHMIQRVCWHSAVGAVTIPCCKDLLPELLLCTALGYEIGAINRVIHEVQESAGH